LWLQVPFCSFVPHVIGLEDFWILESSPYPRIPIPHGARCCSKNSFAATLKTSTIFIKAQLSSQCFNFSAISACSDQHIFPFHDDVYDVLLLLMSTRRLVYCHYDIILFFLNDWLLICCAHSPLSSEVLSDYRF